MKEILGDGAALPESVLFGFRKEEHAVMWVEGSNQVFGVSVGFRVDVVATLPRQQGPIRRASDSAVLCEFECQDFFSLVRSP